MLKAIIVDDEVKSRENLKILIEDFCTNVKIMGLAGNVQEGCDLIVSTDPDLVFLDIQMHKETGFDLLNKFKEISFEVIFTTAHSEYAITAIKFSAVDYLLKPIDINDLKSAIDRVEKKRYHDNLFGKFNTLIENMKANNHEDYKLAIPTLEGLTFVKCSDIVYCEASGNYTTFFLRDDRKYVVSKTLKEYENLLANHQFFRIHHSYLVNLKEIVKYTRGEGGFVTLTNGVNLDVSKRKKESFLVKIGHR